MIRDIPTYNLRIAAELKERLQKEAQIAKRSLNAEITTRLEKSFQSRAYKTGDRVGSGIAEYMPMTDSERAMLAMFRRWTPEKQLALLSLFK